MARKIASTDALAVLFNESSRPIYAVDANRRIVYCNRTLANWLDMESGKIVGREVEFHSEPAADRDNLDAAPLTDLCPPPGAFAGERCRGTLSYVGRDGRLVHRRAEFTPLGDSGVSKTKRSKDSASAARYAVLAIVDDRDLSAQEVTTALTGGPMADELHRTIRRFRRAQASRYSIESLLGNSPAMQKVRAQLAAAVASGANTLICGRPGSGRGHAARAIHYCATDTAARKLVPIDCELLTDDLLRRILDGLRGTAEKSEARPTLLLENLDRMAASHQAIVASSVVQKTIVARIIATTGPYVAPSPDDLERAPQDPGGEMSELADNSVDELPPATIDTALLNAISTITIRLPRLAERAEDLPVLAQFFLEAANQGSSKQVGSVRADALDLLALYSWPGELRQLRETLFAAHRACKTHEILPADLPNIIHHAYVAATHIRSRSERLVLDDLLQSIEREAIVRALNQANGNKSEAAALLGMTRPRLYRRLVQLGLASEGDDDSHQDQPEFIEGDGTS
jgi:transcriptional regulator with PAS, ATPase and Fis domain